MTLRTARFTSRHIHKHTPALKESGSALKRSTAMAANQQHIDGHRDATARGMKYAVQGIAHYFLFARSNNDARARSSPPKGYTQNTKTCACTRFIQTWCAFGRDGSIHIRCVLYGLAARFVHVVVVHMLRRRLCDEVSWGAALMVFFALGFRHNTTHIN